MATDNKEKPKMTQPKSAIQKLKDGTVPSMKFAEITQAAIIELDQRLAALELHPCQNCDLSCEK